MHDHKDVVYAVILSNLAQVVALAVLGFGFIFVASSIVKLRLRTIIPLVLSLAAIGSYALSQNFAGPITLFVFSVIGWLMQRSTIRLPRPSSACCSGVSPRASCCGPTR